MNSLISFSIFVGFIFIIVWAADFHAFSNERTVYPVTCDVDNLTWVQPKSVNFLGVTCPQNLKARALVRTAYRIIPDQQIIIEKSSVFSPRKFSDCVVYDADHWRCDYNRNSPDEVKYIDMADGDFTNTALPSVMFVPKYKWWVIKLGSLAGAAQ